MGVYFREESRLPSGYQEVEYIQSSGTQYINTGFVPTETTEVDIYAQVISTGSLRDSCIIGSRTSTSVNDQWIVWYTNNSNISQGTVAFARANGTTSNLSSADYLNKTHIYTEGKKCYANGTLTNTQTTTLVTPTYALYIFRLNEKNTVDSRGFNGRLFSLKIYNNSDLVRDFVPCYRKSDNVIGLYDLVNNTFYTNSGTGTFAKGGNVEEYELKNAYIGEVLPSL